MIQFLNVHGDLFQENSSHDSWWWFFSRNCSSHGISFSIVVYQTLPPTDGPSLQRCFIPQGADLEKASQKKSWRGLPRSRLKTGNKSLLHNEGCTRVFFCSLVLFIGYGPLTVTVTTRIITFLVGNPYKPSFATVTVRGPHPSYS